MKFIPTKHAIERMRERQIPYPAYRMNLSPAGRKIKRRILKSCPASGDCENGRVYWVYNNRFVYVCKVLTEFRFLIITALDLYNPPEKINSGKFLKN